MRPPRDHHLPPDPDAYRHAPHPTGRIIVIAPTRAACETIELALGLRLETLLEREHGEEIRELAGSGKGFGIVAGTGTGKTLSIRPIAEAILREPLKVGVVNREREATPETPTWNVVIVTTGIARRWFQDDLITAARHRRSSTRSTRRPPSSSSAWRSASAPACRFIWLSATVDPAVLRPLPEQRKRAGHLCVRSCSCGPGWTCCHRPRTSSSTTGTFGT